MRYSKVCVLQNVTNGVSYQVTKHADLGTLRDRGVVRFYRIVTAGKNTPHHQTHLHINTMAAPKDANEVEEVIRGLKANESFVKYLIVKDDGIVVK